MPLDLSRRAFSLGLLASVAAVPAIAGTRIEDPFLGMDLGAESETVVLQMQWVGPIHECANGAKVGMRTIVRHVIKVKPGETPMVDIREALKDWAVSADTPIEFRMRREFRDGGPGVWTPPEIEA